MARKPSYKSIKEVLNELGDKVKERASKALEDGANVVVADAKSRCPVLTGTLRDSIKATPNRDGLRYKISASAVNEGYDYSRIVEFSPKINQPYLYPAKDAHAREIHDSILEAIHKGVKDVQR